MGRTIESFIENRKQENLLRGLVEVCPREGGKMVSGGREYVNLSSNDYLGLASHPDVRAAAFSALGPVFGASSSRLLTGSTSFHSILEREVAEFKGKPAAMVFNSGYQANVGVISALCGRGDCVFSDRLNHASIVDGIKLSGAAPFRFRHNDTAHLEELIKSKRRDFTRALIVTETVFSMDGDIAPLEEMASLKEKYDCMLMVDEAHATGIFGRKGSGITEKKCVTAKVDVIMGTFSKALGSFGAYIALDGKMRDFLVNTCRSFIYSTALPTSVIAASIAAIRLVGQEPFRREGLLDSAEFLRNSLRDSGLEVRGNTHILPIVLGDSTRTMALSHELREKGWWVAPVRPPTVPKGGSRLRVSISYDHDMETLERFIADIRGLI
jgi:8-amino-7-oxononanoate synthase